MKMLQVGLGDRSYPIYMAPGLLDQAGMYCRSALPRAEKIFVVTDSNVAPLYLDALTGSLRAAGFRTACRVVPAGESAKRPELLFRRWEDMATARLTRTDAVAALGGGVVGDLAGFAAATFLRGVDLVQLPTTLLAQVDSSVGGKVAVDLPAGKNLAGAFWQPRLVLMDTDTLSTLEDRTFSDGMAEVIKYGCIRDEGFFRLLEAHPGRRAVMEHIEEVLYTCCGLKRDVVEKDERDTGERMILNFGHTLGHAYERAGRYETWTHGQAVSAGMVLAARLGAALGVTPPETAGEIRALATAFGLPAAIDCSQEDYAAAIGLDKKGAGEDITLVLLARLGKAILHKLPKAELLSLLAAEEHR